MPSKKTAPVGFDAEAASEQVAVDPFTKPSVQDPAGVPTNPLHVTVIRSGLVEVSLIVMVAARAGQLKRMTPRLAIVAAKKRRVRNVIGLASQSAPASSPGK